MSHDVKRYNSVAIILHWVMALAFFVMLASGLAMEYLDLDKSFTFKLYQWHKSGGVLLLMAFFLRIGWRLVSYVPKLPTSFKPWEKIAAKGGHWGLYALMFLMPLSGWIMVSTSVYGLPTIVFNWFEWPHIQNIGWLPFQDFEGNQTIHEIAKEAHEILAIIFGILITAHIGAVIKHAYFEHINLLPRMWWRKDKP